MIASDKTDEGLITPSNQVPETQNGTMSNSIEVLEIPDTNTAVPEVIGPSAQQLQSKNNFPLRGNEK